MYAIFVILKNVFDYIQATRFNSEFIIKTNSVGVRSINLMDNIPDYRLGAMNNEILNSKAIEVRCMFSYDKNAMLLVLFLKH